MFCARNMLAFIFLFASRCANSQPVSLNRIDSLSGALIAKIRNQKKEQTYVTTDKSLYKAGETVWFRVFVLNDASQKISRQSQPVFVELVNEQNNVMSQLLLRAGAQQPAARVFLPDSLPTGYYWLRAYTRNMQLQDMSNFAEQPVYVYNPVKKVVEKNREVTSSPDADQPRMNFFPEGGTMITGAPSVVGVHLANKNGVPISDSAIITDSRDLLTTSFKTDTYGFSKFQFEPFHRMKYVSSVKWHGKVYTFPLPPFNFFSGQISISPQKDGSKKARVLLEDSIYSSDFETYLVAVSKDSLCFASIGSGNYELNIPASKFPPGITTFFLFDKNMKLLSERSVYTRDGLIIKAESDKSIYLKNDKATVTISFANSAGLAEIASFSLAVTGDNLVRPLEKEIDQGDWTLSEAGDLTDEEIDLMMLTKNNVYRNIMSSVATLPFRDSDSLLFIHGTLRDGNDNPLAGKVISLFSKTGANFFEMDTTDIHGRFRFRLTDYPDSTVFTLQSLDNTNKPENWKTELDTYRFPVHATTYKSLRKFNMAPSGIITYLDSSYTENKKVLLQPVEIRKTMPDEGGYDKTKRISPFSHIVPGKIIQEGNGGIGNALFTVPGLKILNGYLVIGGATKFSGIDATSEPMVIVNGIEATVSPEGTFSSPVLNYLNGLDVHTIDFIEVLSGPEAANYGLRGGNGVILVNTTDNYRQSGGKGKSNTLKTFFAKGYQNAPLFTLPANNTKTQSASNNADVRSTVYWNGNVITDAGGKATITFYTNDIPGKYTGTIRGITDHGYVIYKTFTYEVH